MANIEILDECVVIIVVLEVMNDPFVDCFDLFFVGLTIGTNFVSKLFCLCVSQGRTTVEKIWWFRRADEILCGNHRDQNEPRYCQNRNFRQQSIFTKLICRGNEIYQFGDE